MTSAQAFESFGNGVGYVYITAPDGSTIISNVPNTASNARLVVTDALASGPAVSARPGFTVVEFTAVAGMGLNINTFTINGVSQISGAVAATNGDTDTTAYDFAAAINAYVASPDYRAEAVGSQVWVSAVLPGASNNGDVCAIGVDPGITVSTIDPIGGGSDATGAYDPLYGHRYFINPLSTAVQGTLAGATEITDIVVMRGSQTARASETVAENVNALLITRGSSDMAVMVQGNTANIDTVTMPGALPGDRVTLYAEKAAESFTLISGGNVYPVDGYSFSSTTAEESIMLEWRDDDTNGWGWYEICRTTAVPVTASVIRAGGTVVPSTPGVEKVTVPTSGTYTVYMGKTGVAPANSTYKNIVEFNGTVALVGAYVVTYNSASAVAGDTMLCYFPANITLGANTLTVFGKSIPAGMAATGGWAALATWNGSSLDVVIIPPGSGSAWIINSMIATGTITGDRLAAATVLIGNMANNSVGTSQIVNGAVTTSKLDATLQSTIGITYRTQLTIPSADVLTLNSVPVEIVPTPGLGFAIGYVQGYATATFGAASYATNTILTLICNGANAEQARCTGILPITAGTKTHTFQHHAATNVETQLIENVGLMVSVDTGDPTAGDFDITVTVIYTILPV